MLKLIAVAVPLALYGLAYGARTALGRRPSRHALNVELALMLVVYFLVTAGLGIFWVANQQLPPFDFHYLFGYATFILVVFHLVLNARIVFAYFTKGPRAAKQPIGAGLFAKAAFVLALGAGAFFLGMRAGSPRLGSSFGGGGVDGSLAALEQYHELSSHTRSGVLLRAPSVAWDLPVARYIDRGDLPRVSLPAPDMAGSERSIDEALAGWPRPRSTPFARADLSTVLWATAGITDRRGGYELRASASSGALFPTELYVIAHDVEGLAAGVYAYSPEEHALVDLGRRAMADERLGVATGERSPQLLIVVTSVLRRTGQKYRDRAYRYAVADAGHALGNAMIAAAETGMASEIVPAFDDAALADAVGVDNRTEAVLALIALRRGAEPARASGAGSFMAKTLPDVEQLELGVTGLAHEATSLAWIGSTDEDGAAGAVALTAPSARAARPLELIARRRSARSFRGGTLALADVSGVLDSAAAASPVVSRAVRAHVVATRVEGIEPGSLRYRPSAHALLRGRSGDLGARAGRAALDQEVVGGAPVAVVLTLDRATLRAEGARGYRHAFLEAGIIGARLYLASAAYGLGGCSVGAFYDAETADLLGVDIGKEWPIHFFALGAPD